MRVLFPGWVRVGEAHILEAEEHRSLCFVEHPLGFFGYRFQGGDSLKGLALFYVLR